MAGHEAMRDSSDSDPTAGEQMDNQGDPEEEDGESAGDEESGGGTDKILAEDHHAGQPEQAEEGDGLGPTSFEKEVITDETPWQGTDQIQEKVRF
jgi:hypothetical protein